jgi:hypothetical protein
VEVVHVGGDRSRAPENHARIFEPFWKVGGASTRSGEEMGIGLATAARLLGGKLEVESALAQGSTFSLRLPPARSRHRKAADSFALGAGMIEICCARSPNYRLNRGQNTPVALLKPAQYRLPRVLLNRRRVHEQLCLRCIHARRIHILWSPLAVAGNDPGDVHIIVGGRNHIPAISRVFGRPDVRVAGPDGIRRPVQMAGCLGESVLCAWVLRAVQFRDAHIQHG